jgi:16S rRNA (cytosine1402-N4)-methyltransferase
MDGTFGRGGHSGEILQRLDSSGRLLAIDKDPEAVDCAVRKFGQDDRFTITQGSFAMLEELAQQSEIQGEVNGILLDLGVSSPQLNDAGRGFSFMQDGPLDMRMDNRSGRSAANWLATADEDEITTVLKEYGEERFARRIARNIVESRQEEPLVTTSQLVALIEQAVPGREQGKHPATRSFQAIRIFINRELEDLSAALEQSLRVLAAGGRLVVISFHSLEDRIVKRFIRDYARGEQFPPEVPVTVDQLRPKLLRVGAAVRPAEDEVAANPRARSAVLRVAERAA